jgi:molybdopterin-containing oxidoreductase family iron-sulfur binding subunit
MKEHDIVSGQEGTGIDRREFLRLTSTVAAASALASAGCQVPPEATVPFHDMPSELVGGLGHVRLFHTVIDGTPVLVRTREGRPILVAPRPGDASGRGVTLRHQAALMDLYDPDRARGPLSVRRSAGPAVATNWNAISTDVVVRLKDAGPRAVLLTGPVDSPALQSAIVALTAQTGVRHVAWAPLDDGTAASAWMQAFGSPRVGRPRLDKADLIVGLGAEFLGRPADGLEPLFAARRSPDNAGGARMSRFVQLEGRLTLTGANADQRIRTRDSHLATVGTALAHELIVAQRIGPLAGDATVSAALAPFSINTVAAATGINPAALHALAAELARGAGRALVVSGGTASTAPAGSALELVTLALNVTVGAFDAGLFDDVSAERNGDAGLAFAALAADMNAGNVELLIVAGPNPVYDAPQALKVTEALAKVPFVVSLNDRLDETSLLADLLAPASHPFESWGDAALPGGLLAVQQPVIQSLHNTRGLLDILIDWAAALGNPAALAAITAAMPATAAPAVATGQRAPSPSPAFHFLRAGWAGRLALDPATPAFEKAWTDVLRTGQWQGAATVTAPRTFRAAALASLQALVSPSQQSDELELQLYPHLALADGRAANNGWLHELPDPITRLTWGAAVSIAPRRFDDMGLTNGDLIEVDAGHAKVVAPAYRHAGMHHDQIALPLGYGRSACGVIGNGVGANAFTLRRLDAGRMVSAGLPVTIRKTGGHEPLALAQGSDVIDRARRPLVPATTLSAYQQDPKAGTEQVSGGPSSWPAHQYLKARWAMAIDLSKCTGCAKCVIGCQAENNIPVVGRAGMIAGREMSWLRIDRYYDAPAKDGGWDAGVWDGPLEVTEEPQALFEPMLCQHCENAPCETVCPFVATMHSEDGLNQQIYNRCVGTRYCANNCPFKVRRFNYWELGKKQESGFFRWLVPQIAVNGDLNAREPMQMKNNPEVTVRSRGVMEKCSFCVQRIRAATAEATRNGQPKDHLPEGTVVPACMEACSTRAITFGDINVPDSQVAALADHPRAMKLLDSLGVKPSVSYLTKVRNDQA